MAAVTMGVPPLAADEGPPRAPPARLVYTRARGTERCPDQAALRAAVASRLGYDPFRDQADRAIVARVQRASKKLEGSVEMRDGHGVVAGARRLSAELEDCDELVAAMALAISIAIDPRSALRPPSPSAPLPPSAPPSLPPPTAPPPPAEPAPSVPAPGEGSVPIAMPLPAALPRSSAEPWRARVRLGALATLGTLPRVTLGIALDAGFRRRWFSLTGGLEIDLPAARAADAGGSVSAWAITGRLTPCAHLGPAALCALAAAGGVRGSGAGVRHPRAETTPLVSLGARAALELPIAGVLGVAPYVELGVPVTRTVLRLEGADVWTAPPISGAIGAALVAHFP